MRLALLQGLISSVSDKYKDVYIVEPEAHQGLPSYVFQTTPFLSLIPHHTTLASF